MFDDTKLDVVRSPAAISTRSSPSHPVAVNHRGGHTSWYNSKALELAGITRDTPRSRTTAGSSGTTAAS